MHIPSLHGWDDVGCVWPTEYRGGDKYLLKTPKRLAIFSPEEGLGHRGHQHVPMYVCLYDSYAAQTMPSNIPIFGMQIGTIKETGPNRADFFLDKDKLVLVHFFDCPSIIPVIECSRDHKFDGTSLHPSLFWPF